MNSHIKKPFSIAGLVCLTFFLLALGTQPAGLQAGMSFFVKVGAGYGGQTQDYNANGTFNYFQETGTFTGAYKLDAKGFILETGVGIFFTPNIGLEILFVPDFGKTGTAEFSAQVPHPFHFNQFRTATWAAADLAYSATELDLHLVGRFPMMENKMDVYVAAGMAWFPSVKVTSLSDLSWEEAGYPYTDVTASPTYTAYTKGIFGVSLGGGVDYFIFKGLGIFVSGRYVIASATLAIGEGASVEVKPGGLRITGGIKYMI